MDTFSRISPTQRSNFAAYLDGELDEHEAAEIETVLSHSAVARNDVELLARTYDLLDYLPRVQATEQFTERTLASVRLEATRPNLVQAAWDRVARRALWLGAWTLVMLLASSAGYLVAQAWIPNDADILVRDFEVIQRLDMYQEVGDPEFLKQLADRHPALLEQIHEQVHGETGR